MVSLEEAKLVLKFATDEVARLEKNEAEKPELRHGDYGYDNDNAPGLIVLLDSAGMKVADEDYVFEDEDAEGNAFNPTTILGNIFDDLKAMAEDLTEFVVGNTRYKLDGDHLRIGPVGSGWQINIDVADFSETVRNLRCMQATHQRRQ